MTDETALRERCGGSCELCAAQSELAAYEVPASTGQGDASIMLCEQCREQIDSAADSGHWQCLRDSMWSPVPAVQVMAWRLLKRHSGEAWAQDLLDMLYLDEELLAWAEAGALAAAEDVKPTLDCNGAVLQAGDTVTLIKDLEVKGAGFTAKRGTAVRNISLTDNPEHIEGRVNGTRIVLLTQYLKKSN